MVGGDDREGVSLSGMSEATRTVGPDMGRIGAIDAKAFLLVTGFFIV